MNLGGIELVSEHLGPRNRIDEVAGDALLLAYKLKRPELLRLSTELAELSTSIPYDNDMFDIKVNPKYEETIKAIENAVNNENQEEVIKSAYVGGWQYELKRDSRGHIYICAQTSVLGLPGMNADGCYRSVVKSLVSEISKTKGPLKQKVIYTSTYGHQFHEIKGYVTEGNEVVLQEMEHIHEDPNHGWYSLTVGPDVDIDMIFLWDIVEGTVRSQIARRKEAREQHNPPIENLNEDRGVPESKLKELRDSFIRKIRSLTKKS